MKTNLTVSPRSRALTLLGVIFVMIGVSQVGTADQVSQSALVAYKAHLALLPLSGWGIMFCLTGLVALYSAFVAKHTIGFFVTMYASSIWSLLFLVSFCLTGYGRAIPSILIWAFVSLIIYVMSDWPDPVNTYSISPVENDLFDFGDDV